MTLPRCYICDKPAPERDHFPIPAALGGTKKLPICRGCHDAKDRYNLDDWDPAYTYESLSGLWDKASPDERLILAKMVTVTAHATHELRNKLTS